MFQVDARPETGHKAPDFTLVDSIGDKVRLYDILGKENVLLAFYRGQADPYGLGWLSTLSDDYLAIRALDTEVLAISSDNMEKALDTGGRYELPFRLLCDPELNVISAYNVEDDMESIARTAAFVIDKTGTIRYMYVGRAAPDVPSDIDILKVLRKMTG